MESLKAIVAQVLIVAIAAWLQKTEHSRIIDANEMTAHIKRVWAACRTAVLILAALFIGHLTTNNLWASLANIGASLALFPALFNPWINKARGWHRFYLGGTAFWDVTAIAVVTGRMRSWIKANHQENYTHWHAYENDVHRAGSILFHSYLCTAIVLFGISIYLSNHQ